MNNSTALGFPQRTRWGVVLMLMAFPLLGHFNRLSISVVGTERLIGTDGMTPERMGWIYTMFLLFYTGFMIPGGWFIDRVGPAAALKWMALVFGACAVLTGVLGGLPIPMLMLWIGLIVVRSLAGMSSAPLHPGAARGVALWATPHSRATANGLVTAAALVGISITYPGFGWLMDQFGWPVAMAMGGAALFVYGLIWQQFGPGNAASAAPTQPEPSAIDEPHTDAGPDEPPAWKRLLGNRSLLLLTASYTALGYLQYVFFYWVQFYFETVLERPTEESRWASFVITMSMAVGMALGGRSADAASLRFGDRWGRRLIALGGMCTCAVFAWLGVRSGDPSQVTLLFSLALAALGMCEGIFWATATDIGGHQGGLSASILNTGGNAVGAFAPTITPWLATHLGWEGAIGIACAICAVGGGLWLGIDPARDSADPGGAGENVDG